MHLPEENAPVGSEGGKKTTRADYTDRLSDVLPEPMLAAPNWLLWRSVPGESGGKARKVPYYVNGDPRGTDKKAGERFGLDTPEDRARLASFEEAAAAYDAAPGRWAGLGFAVVEGCGIAGVDLDNCLDADGRVIGDAAESVVTAARVAGCYIEVSPSGRGLRVFGSSEGFDPVKDAGFEAYANKRFLTVTGECRSNQKAWGSVDAVAELVRAFVGGDPLGHTPAHLTPGVVDINADLLAHAGYQVPEQVAEGGRNAAVLAYAGHLRGRGLPEDAVRERAHEFNRTRCVPPLDDDEVADIIGRYERSDRVVAGEDVPRRSETLNDSGNADRFVAEYSGRVIYVPELRRWYLWRDGHWRCDERRAVIRLAQAVARRLFAEAAAEDDNTARTALTKWANASLQLPKLEAMLTLAQPSLAVSVNDLDSDDMLLGVQNGVVDLRTGRLRTARPEDLITRVTPVAFDPNASCPTWEAAVGTWTGGDEQLAGFLRRVVGYALTGSTRGQCFFFLHGSGRNGKSAFMNVLRELVGPYGVASEPGVLMLQRYSNPSGPTPEIARLAGARVVTMVETQDGERMDESRVKAMTGGDAITARTHHAEPFTFRPKFKLFLAGNHRPIIGGDDTGIWRRVVFIPFTVEIPPDDVDEELPEKLRAEMPGILRWAVEGCLKWQRFGLAAPESVTRAVAAYRSDMDTLAQWIDEACEVGPGEPFRARELYELFSRWAEGGGFRPVSETNFGRKLAERGYTRKRTAQGYVYTDIRRRPLARLAA